jgi:hypothetical protein
MNHQWFDNLTRAMAPVSRRESLKVVAISLAGRVLPTMGVGASVLPSRAAADKRPTRPEIAPDTVELLGYQDAGYRYETIPLGAAPPSGWEQPLFDESGFQFGQAAFGSGGNCPLQSTVRTMWPSNSQLLVRSVVSIPLGASNLRVVVSAHSGIVGVFFDGYPLTHSISHHDCPVEDEFRFDVAPSRVTPGEKIIAFQILDHGDEAFFDARILADLPRAIFAGNCSGNTLSVPCNELNDYLKDCGVVCPDGRLRPGEFGCTICDPQPSATRVLASSSSADFGEHCVTEVVSVFWEPTQPQTSVISYQPTACCDQQCKDEIADVTSQLQAHERSHRAVCGDLIAEANVVWLARSFTACGPTARLAGVGLSRQIKSAIAETRRTIVNTYNKSPEPEQARMIECAKCIPAQPGRACVNGSCTEACSRSSRCPDLRVDCSRAGRSCFCTSDTEGFIRCAGPTSANFCVTDRVRCMTSDGCERLFGRGWFCMASGTGCCGCHPLPTGKAACDGFGTCVPPC